MVARLHGRRSYRAAEFLQDAGARHSETLAMKMLPSQMLRIALAFAAAFIAGYIFAIVFATSANLINLREVGAQIGLGDALRTYLYDLTHMLPRFEITRYGTVMIIGLAIAFPVAALLRHAVLRGGFGPVAPWLYPLAGAVAIGTGLTIMFYQYEVTAVAGARGLGFWTQCVAGAIAGFVFQKVLVRRADA
jgi:hypothetical protein